MCGCRAPRPGAIENIVYRYLNLSALASTCAWPAVSGLAAAAALAYSDAAAAQTTAASPAQAYPSKPIRMVVPQSAGGSTDLVARPLAQKLAEVLGQAVVVENRPGAGSVIGTDFVAKAAPDGYTLLAVAASVTMSPSLYKLPFDPVRDLAPISVLLRAAQHPGRASVAAGQIAQGNDRARESYGRGRSISVRAAWPPARICRWSC